MVSGSFNTALSSQIVRLAHSHPKFRSELQSLLHVIAAKKVEFENAVHRRSEQKELSKLLSFGPRFGVLSANEGKDDIQNRVRRAKLLGDLARLGYRKVSPLRGKWDCLSEDSLLIQNIRPGDLFQLGHKYDQPFVVLADEPGLVGFYYLTDDLKTRIIVNPKGDAMFRSLTDSVPHASTRDLDVGFGFLWSQEFPWDGRTPLTRQRIRTELKSQGLKSVTP